MAFTVQNDDGTISGANAYITVAEFKNYHDDRGNDYGTYTTPEIEAAIVNATDYTDERWEFLGEPRNHSQDTEWPRLDVEDSKGIIVRGIPSEVKEATAEYAIRHLAGETLDPDLTYDDRGQKVQRKKEVVGPIEEETEYVGGSAEAPKSFPGADKKLIRSGYTIRPGNFERG